VEINVLGAGHLQVDHPSPTAGIFLPAVSLWDAVQAGQVLGWIRHADGRVLASVQAARSGRVLLLRTLPRVFAGETVAFVLSLPEGAP
jgi:predicted deacylase